MRPVLASPFDRLSIRATLVTGVLVTLALWLYTGYSFARRLDYVERQAATVADRYLRAQDLLTTVRTQVLVASVRVRDALLNPDGSALSTYREQVAASYRAIDAALAAYVPVIGTADEHGGIERLRLQVEEFRASSADVLSDTPRQSTAEIRELLNAHVVPRREAAIRISEEVQALNRAAFLRQQTDMAAIHRTAEEQSLRRLGGAFAMSIGVLFIAAAYAGRLERRLHAQIDRSATLSRELQSATTQLMHAQEHERRTIARELHDEVGQVLTAVKVELGLAQRDIEARGLSAAPLEEARNITAGAIRTVRDITQLLHPSALDDLGLPAAIDALVRGLARRQDIEMQFAHDGLDSRIDPETEVAAYRIVQEALTNVGRHARASRCRVQMTCRDGRLVIDVADDGAGMSGPGLDGRPGIGLIGIRERVAGLGGAVEITSASGHGTRIRAELPARRVPAREDALA